MAVLLTVLCSYLPPAKHRFVDMLAPGAADLIPTINAAYALKTGVNLYHVAQLLVPDPYFYSRGEAEGVSYLYPPSHALLYVPLAWIAQWNFFDAIRAQYIIAVVCIALLAWLVVRVLRLVVDLDPLHGSLLLPVVGLVLALNPGNLLGIERGQSDVITSVFAWSAVLCFCRRRLASMAFFAMAASLLKGYGVLLAIGLLAIGALENWRRTVLGAAAALGCLLLPVYRYLPDAAHAYGIRSTMFWSGWTNQGFANLAFSLGIARDGGRVALTAVAILSAATAWVCLLRSDRLRDERARSFGATGFATAALTSVVGYSLNSISYAVIVVMPGALVLMLGQDRFFPRLLGWRRALVGSLLTLASGALFLFDVAEVFVLRPRWLHVPLAAAAEVVFVAIVLISSLSKLRTSLANSKTRLSVRSPRRFEPVAHPDSRIGRSS